MTADSLEPSLEARRALCREVVERLSELIEGEAPEEFCQRVEEVLGECRPFLAFRATFAATMTLAAEVGGIPPPDFDDEAFVRCVVAARHRLGQE